MGAKNKSRQVGKAMGLCSTCESISSCMYVRTSQYPILECEQFECVGCEDRTISTTPVIQSQEVQPTVRPLDKYEGLCVNCDNREVRPQVGCGFIKAGTKSLYCEEYS